jgi:hypothetical protein
MPSTLSSHKDDQPETWPGVAAGLAIFLIAGLMLVLAELPRLVQPAPWAIFLRSLSFWGVLFVSSAGLAGGWIMGFPRWSYPYVPLAVFFLMYIANASTPGLTFFGYPTFGRQLWGLRACIPLLLGIGLAWLVTHSFNPFKQFFTQIGKEWSLGTYALSGTLPLVIFIAYDEMDRAYSLRDMIVLTAMLVLMALFYLRSRSTLARRLTVGIGISLVLGYTAVSTTLIWHNLGPGNVFIPGMIAWTVILVIFYLSPGILVSIAKAVQTAKAEA